MGYRNDKDAKQERRGQLVDELRQIQDKLAESDHLEKLKGDLHREIAKVSKNIDKARSKKVLPLLSEVRVAAPCNESWDGMQGSETVRHCGSCDKKVFDLSALTGDEAEALLSEHSKLCVRFYRRKDGTIMTSDCVPGVKRRRRNRMVAGAVGLGATLTGFGALAGVATQTMVQGEMMPMAQPCQGKSTVEPCDSEEGHMVLGQAVAQDEAENASKKDDSAKDLNSK